VTAVTWRVAVSALGLAVAAALAACGGAASTAGPAANGPTASGSAAAQQQPAPGRPASTVSAAALNRPDGKFFGVEADGSPDSLGPAQEVAASVGRAPNLLGTYVEWGSPFDETGAARATSYGALYFMAWEPFGTTIASIADGGSDAYVTSVAKAVAAFRDPVAISFGHEMNGNWYPWGTTETTPAEFVAAWRHIHDLFAAAGATNVIWIWNPNVVNPMPTVELEPFWPGSAYVNWVGLTGYFGTTGPYSFASAYGETIAEVGKFTNDPVIIAETAVQTGPEEVTSIRSLIDGVRADSNVLGFIWFEYDKNGVDWTLTDRPTARAAVAGGVAGLHLVSLSG
jgi:hypothetical protein